jgi:hypothetical protein
VRQALTAHKTLCSDGSYAQLYNIKGEIKMNKVIRLALMLLVIPMVASAQWEFAGVFPDSTTYNNSHGMVVDANDNLWSAPYFSLLNEAGDERSNPVFIWDADGVAAEFSPIIGTMTGDSLLRFGPITGVSRGADGNIYVASHGFRMTAAATDAAPNPVIGGVWRSTTAFIHVINPETGEGVEVVEVKYMRTETASHAPNRPAVTDEGFVALSFVFPASPIVILDPSDEWNVLNTVTSDKLGFSRTLAISSDGSMIFNPQTEPFQEGAPAGHIQVLEGGVFDEYEVGNPIAPGANPGSIARYPNSDILFFSGAGVGNDPNAIEPWVSGTFYGYSLNSRTIIETFDWNYVEGDAWRIPRGMAFSDDGLTAYLGSFTQGAGNIQKFTRAEALSVERGADVASGFVLNQNYPNPFNPSTTISYTLADAGFTTIRVYDMLGRVVATLLSQDMPAGTHSVNFDASQLGSGVYLYELSAGNVRLTNKMTLVK